MSGTTALEELRMRLAELHDLRGALGVLGWDQRTMMPPRGAEARGEALATLGRLVHERFTSDAIGRLLDDLRPLEESLPYDSDDAALVRVTRRDWERARRVPPDVTADWLRAGAAAQAVWLEARPASDFGRFLPALRRVHECALRWAEHMEAGDEPYDVFLDEYEPGMRTAEVREVFGVLQPALTELVTDAGEPADDSFLQGDFPLDRQQAFLEDVLRRFGFDEGSWRLDPTVHPFATSFARSDIRMTSRFEPTNLRALWAGMHEAGHGLTFQGVDPALERTPLADGPSLGLGESQSRTWENLVGRSLAFWRGRYGELQRTFPDALAGVPLETFYRGINRVAPGPIRVDADEVTYSLHIILRFELEQRLVDGSLALEELPEAWNARMAELLGVEVSDDGRGVLQDVHWTRAAYGYFPTYALGNVLSVQIWERLREELGDVDALLVAGEFRELYGWLQRRLYRHGRKFTPTETLERAIGSGRIDPQPYLAYLRGKVAALRT
ncbi:MAG TPA: carboxypeptidase M32 [Gaiellaceae bacterium]|nr:carboxypeptidase M32 [Gaiellaceae bacterium]